MGASFEASFSSIPATYINLDKRRDRSTAVEAEFDRMGLTAPERFSAIEDENAMLGAARSHLAVLERFRQSSPSSLVMVCEDDIVFLESRAELDGALREFTQDPRLDVLCIAFMLKNTTRDIVPAQIRASKRLQVANHILTQACYVLKPSAVEPVIRSLRQSVRLLSLGVPWSFAAGDVYWQTLQQGRLFFAIPANRLARQSAGYSDIWGTNKTTDPSSDNSGEG